MKNPKRVTIILATMAIVVIFIGIFAFSRDTSVKTFDEKAYKENIQMLNDTIKELKKDIARYELEIQRIDRERETIQKELELITKSNEKIDNELANGDWDDNIRFLTEYLSKKDNMGK